MYKASLSFGQTSISLSHDAGVEISSISGLTGLNSSYETTARADGVGDIVADGGKIEGKAITIKGFVLDGNTSVRVDMINKIKPLSKGVLTVAGLKMVDGVATETPYEIDVIVKQSPVFSQETHSAFTISLYAPFPFWRESGIYVRNRVINLVKNTAVEHEVTGTFTPEFGFEATVTGASCSSIAIYQDYSQTQTRLLFVLVFGENPLPVGSSIKYWREQGKVRLTANNTSRIDAYSLDNVQLLPLGEHTYYITVNGGTGVSLSNAKITYQPAIGGIMSYDT